MVFRRPWSSMEFKAFRRWPTRLGAAFCGVTALSVTACSLMKAGAVAPVSWAGTCCRPADFADAKFIAGVLLGLATAALCGCLFSLRRSAVARRLHSALTPRMATQDQLARQFQDDLIKGLQGLIVTLQVIAENNPAARVAIEDALSRAEAFLIESRDRLQALQDTRTDGQSE